MKNCEYYFQFKFFMVKHIENNRGNATYNMYNNVEINTIYLFLFLVNPNQFNYVSLKT